MKFREVINKLLTLFDIKFHIKIQVWHSREDMLKGDVGAYAEFNNVGMAKRLYGDYNCEQVAFGLNGNDKLFVYLVDPSPDDTDELQVIADDAAGRCS